MCLVGRVYGPSRCTGSCFTLTPYPTNHPERSYTPVAEVATQALDFWVRVLPSDLLKPHFSAILPCLELYLNYSASGATAVATEQYAASPQQRKDADHWTSNGESAAHAVRLKAIDLLGRLGGEVNVGLADLDAISGFSSSGEPSPWMAWDMEKRLP